MHAIIMSALKDFIFFENQQCCVGLDLKVLIAGGGLMDGSDCTPPLFVLH